MGLDMYLYKAKKLKEGISAKEISLVDNVLWWKERGQKYSLNDWCGIEEKQVDWDLVDLYKKEEKQYFYPWDVEKRCPYRGIQQMIGDWRKSNAIHQWFVKNVQEGVDDCSVYEVSETQLKQLLQNCYNIVASKKNGVPNIDVAKELLPTQSGFFFGSTDYDEYYFLDIEKTIQILENVLKTTDFDNEMIIYSSSW